MQPRNLAARAGRWSATHRKTAILGWILFVVLATMIGGKVGQQNLESSKMGNGESKRHDMIVDDANYPDEIGERVLIQGKGSIKADSPEVTAAVKDVVNRLGEIKGVSDIESPLNAEDRANTVSKDGRSVLVTFTLPGKAETKEEQEALETRRRRPARGRRRRPEGASRAARAGARRRVRAQGARRHRARRRGEVAADLDGRHADHPAARVRRGRRRRRPAAARHLRVRGHHRACSGRSASSRRCTRPSQIVTMLIGLAVGVDYAMFYLRRMMEEQDKGRSPEAALDVAAATSGRAVLISGFTVIAAMAGMFFSGNAIFSSFGIGTILVVAVAMIGSLTFLPAVLSYLGQKGWLEKGRVPYIAKRRHKNKGESRVWNAILTRVLARPGRLGGRSPAACSSRSRSRRSACSSRRPAPRACRAASRSSRRSTASTPRSPAAACRPASSSRPRTSRRPRSRPRSSSCTTRRSPRASSSEPSSVTVNPDKTVAMVSLSIKGKGTDAASNRSLEVLRDDVVPATVGKLQNAEVAVGGMTAWSKDFLDTMKSHLPIVFGFVLAMAFILLLVTFRSIVVPIKAIILNLLSVGSAYGVLTLVFQDGHGEKALGFTSVGGITPWLPLFLFVVLFGLSMDYHVFVLSKVRELVDRGMSTEKAVAEGIKSTAGVITGAAAVMVVTFAAFATGSDQQMKQLGVGLAVAILIDATIVRAVLLPATMKLLGERNWWLPKRLNWLPKFEHEPEVAPAR